VCECDIAGKPDGRIREPAVGLRATARRRRTYRPLPRDGSSALDNVSSPCSTSLIAKTKVAIG
jgi:hypothetical protein